MICLLAVLVFWYDQKTVARMQVIAGLQQPRRAHTLGLIGAPARSLPAADAAEAGSILTKIRRTTVCEGAMRVGPCELRTIMQGRVLALFDNGD